MYLSLNRNHVLVCTVCLKLLYTGEHNLAPATRHPGVAQKMTNRKKGKADEIHKLRCANAL